MTDHAYMVSMNRLTTEKRAQIIGMMAAGVSQTLWSLTDIVRVVDEWESERATG